MATTYKVYITNSVTSKHIATQLPSYSDFNEACHNAAIFVRDELVDKTFDVVILDQHGREQHRIIGRN